MSDKRSHNSDSRVLFMSATAEASFLIKLAAEPRPVGDTVKAAIRRASRRVGLTFSRSRDIWYGQARRVDASEMDKLRAVNAAEEQARDEYRDALTAFRLVAHRLATIDPDFAREIADAVRSLEPESRAAARAMDR